MSKPKHCMSNISARANTLKHTQGYTNTTPAVALHEKAHSLGSLAPVLSGLHSKWPPHDHTHYGLGRQPPQWTEAPRVRAVIHGTRVCKRSSLAHRCKGKRRAEAVWRWGCIKKSAGRTKSC
ncbi:hypothetical protein ILYODFUR_002013 [Ilyodon furcidens]|uniref:Uncharacterized protein n=1 Tax=Ilyodon furcidens TaxID=33524 RepID=A0ABV0UPE4_9TELE